MISIRKTFLSLCLAGSALGAVSCADVPGESSEGDSLASDELADEKQDVAKSEQALNQLWTVTFPQNWGLGAEGAAPPENDFRFSQRCEAQSCQFAQGTTVRIRIWDYDTNINCYSDYNEHLSGPYVMIYNLSSNWQCTRDY